MQATRLIVGRYIARSAMMVPVTKGRFETGRNVRQENASAKQAIADARPSPP